MDIFDVLTLLGGLAIFLYGMNMMGDGLEKFAGSKLKGILERLTSNTFKGILLGAAVTAIIQSSSATTVMVVGFVNSGLMQLSQAVGIIMGANIGTTITAWLLSTTGMEGSGWIAFLKPTSFSPILAVIGIVLLMFISSGKKKHVGTILLGFAILIFGMDSMSGAVEGLKSVPEFTSILTMFGDNPILGLLVGAVLTAIIQSSSASVGILQALSVTGKVSAAVAIPVIMGQHIGTCITAMISSMGANKNAKRAALVHLYFNVIGMSVLLVAFYVGRIFVPADVLRQTVDPAKIAVIHSVISVIAVCLWIPFSKFLEKLACLTIRDNETPEEATMLDERLLATPSVALDQCRTTTMVMADVSRNTLDLSLKLLSNYNDDDATTVRQWEKQADEYEDLIGTYLVKLSSRSLNLSDSHEVARLLHCIGDFERISDHALSLAKTAREINDKQIVFSPQAQKGLETMYRAVSEVVRLAVEAFEKKDLQLAARVEPLEQVVDLLKKQLKAQHIERLQKGECTTEMGFIFSDIITECERVADHCSNIAVCLIQVHQDSFETHEYLNALKSSNNEDFNEMYDDYKAEYALQ